MASWKVCLPIHRFWRLGPEFFQMLYAPHSQWNGKKLETETSSAPVQQLAPCDDRCGHIKSYQCLGTSIAEWLEVSQFMYPVIPSPQVSWSNAEGLLALGAKYDMPAIVSLAGKFLLDNLSMMDLADKGDRCCWRWLQPGRHS